MTNKIEETFLALKRTFNRLSRKYSKIMIIRKCARAVMHTLLWLDYRTSNAVPRVGQGILQLNTNKVFCMAHYSNSSSLDPFDAEILQCAKDMGFTTILFTNQTGIQSQYVDQVIRKPSRGRDGAVLVALARSLSTFTKFSEVEIWFVNSSVVWDITRVSALYNYFKNVSTNTIVFPTQSNYPSFHVQPYFIFVRLNTQGLEKFSTAFEWIRATRFKRTTVAFYEYRLAKILQQMGWNIEVICDLKKSYELSEIDSGGISFEEFLKTDFNPSSDIWEKLRSVNVPCVKKRILLDCATQK